MATTTDQARIDPAAHIAAARTAAIDAIVAAEVESEGAQVLEVEHLAEILDTFAAAVRHAGVMEGMGFTIANRRQQIPCPQCGGSGRLPDESGHVVEPCGMCREDGYIEVDG